ncbi:MAG: ribbon-helix-helix domain-containing protein [Rhodospirillaceae bacterium]|jgi:predicted DNA-binding ribbon-helix-helix protein|nr:ribbon-helix-helix domain-containing protein [Rhodospirillaceae bacterium]MBT4489929.1 ribbon-helix-helix domain-containing protein [Rhodospirillaceae bacterium]MBT5193016.1 ribbon-helix-helix domain-containing protein [Rhodospirillaceae bacterium]MBT5896845.1 ribbon-helix-helix domain-containing protein [Rhodospirillaceae bacterium]MBT6429246.1 ribbon-helix-helix domain-containing protein [Rhodospirillaceae bacterium]
MPGDDEELLRRSFRIAGHQTSLSMERAFWDEFRRMARADRRSMTELISEIDAQRTAGLSRAVRVYILGRLQRAAGNQGDTQ